MAKNRVLPMPGIPIEVQLKEQRRTVDFDTFDIHMQQLVSMVKAKQIKVSPAYQRKFRWSDKQCSQFIESILLGIPVPSLFMATDADSTWEVVDGVQRLSTIIKFAGDEETRKEMGIGDALVLSDLEKLSQFNELSLEDFPANLQNHFWTRPAKVVTLNDKSDDVVRYDLFERLNTGGVALSAQEIRDCVYRGPFANQLEVWANDKAFKKVVSLTALQQRDATAEECVLRFFAFLHRYQQFDHNVTTFLNDYMRDATAQFDYVEGSEVFAKTFKEIGRVLPAGIRRPKMRRTTPLNLFEGVAVGAALALRQVSKLHGAGISKWLDSPELRSYTTAATNDRRAVRGRIEFCRDRFLGKPYVPTSSA